MRSIAERAQATEGPARDEVLDAIASAMRDLKYGSIEVVIHDARVVQIVRTEKLRVEK